jgi:hypothetical protein
VGNAYLEGYKIGSDERAQRRQMALQEEISRGELALKQAAEARAQAAQERDAFFGPYAGVEKSPFGAAVGADLGELQRTYDIRRRGAFAESDLKPGEIGPPAPDTRPALDAQDEATRHRIDAQMRDLLGMRYTGAADIRAGAQLGVADKNAAAKVEAARIAASAAGQKQATRAGEDDRKAARSFYDKYNAGMNRTTTALGMSEAMKFRINELKALPESVDFQPTPNEMTEFYTRLASMLGSGGSGGQVAHSLVKEINPSWLGQDVTRLRTYLSGEVLSDPQAMEWVKRGMRTLARMDSAADTEQRKTVHMGAMGYQPELQAEPDRFRKWWAAAFPGHEDEADQILELNRGGPPAQMLYVDPASGKVHPLDPEEIEQAKAAGWRPYIAPGMKER